MDVYIYIYVCSKFNVPNKLYRVNYPASRTAFLHH